MKTSKSLVIVSLLAGLMAAIQSAVGLFYLDGGSPFNFTTLHGTVVKMAGQGIYAFDTYFKAPIFRGTDFVTLFVCVPLLAVSLLLYTRGSLRGKLLLTSTLAYLLYNAASVAFGVAYNNLFLIYLGSFSASLFAFILAVTNMDLHDLASRISSALPRKGIAALLFFSAVGLLFAWFSDILFALIQNRVPAIDSYTTEVTYILDLGIIVPSLILSGLLVLRRAPVGYLMSTVLLVVLVIIGAVLTSQTIFQLLAGITLTTGEFIGKDGSFMVLSLIAIWLNIRFFRGIREPESKRSPRTRASEASL